MRRRRRHRMLGCALLVVGWLPLSLPAQVGPRAPVFTPHAALDPITTEDGLPHGNVHCVLQDRRGFLWFGTDNGLTRYDGVRFSTFHNEPGNPASLSFNVVNALHEDGAGTLWIGTGGGGVNRFDPVTETFTRFRPYPDDPNHLSYDDVRAIESDARGRLWIGTNGGGLFTLDPDTDTFSHIGDTYDPGPIINDLSVDERGGLWVGAFRGHVSHLDPETGRWTRHWLDGRDLGSRISTLHASRAEPGVVWVGTGGGLFRLEQDTGRLTRFSGEATASSWLPQGAVQALYEDADGTLWIGSDEGGLGRYAPETGRFERFPGFEPGDDPTHSVVRTLFEDRSGVLWVGVYGSGLFRFAHRNEPFLHIRHDPKDPNSLAYAEVWGVYEDREGILWITTRGRGPDRVGGGSLDRLDRRTGQVTHFAYDAGRPSGLPHYNPAQILEDADGILWIASDGGGLIRFDRQAETPGSGPGQAFTRYVRPYPAPKAVADSAHSTVVYHTSYLYNNQVKAILVPADAPGVLWVGGENGGGVSRFDTRSETFTHFWRIVDDEASLGSSRIHSLYESPYEPGIVWIGTLGAGLDRLEPESARSTHYRHRPDDPHSLSSNFIMDIQASRTEPDILWIGTYDGGLNRLDRTTGRVTRFSARDGLADDLVYAVLEDDRGYLWISTSRGLNRFDPRTGRFLTYDRSDGLQSNQFHDTAHFYSRRTGEMFFGGANGLTVFHPDSIGQHVIPPAVVLTGLQLSNEPVPIGTPESPLDRHIAFTDKLVIAHTDRVVTFEYAALHYAAPEKNRYRYRLEGFDEDWVEAGNRTEAPYTNLDPGLYTFRVIGADKHGVWNEEGASIRLRVLPPWWQTTGAYVAYGLLLLSTLLAAGRMQRRRLIRRERERAMAREVAQARQIEAMNVQLRAHEQQLEDQNRRLLELDELKSRFFANISHEFRTPLTLILGPLRDLLDETHGPLRRHQVEQLGLMQRHGRRLLHLINQLLDLSRLEAGHLTLRARRGDLVSLVRTTAEAFASMARRKHIALQVETPRHEVSLYFEADKLEKVFYNLLSNAFKFTPEHGTIRVGIDEGVGASAGFVEVRVTDTGPGIPAGALPFIFDRFYQADVSSTRAYEGTGIGLALTKELVALHGGTIRAESEEGAGATFTVRLPKGHAHLSDDDLVETEVEAAEPETVDPAATLTAVDDVIGAGERPYEPAGDGHTAPPRKDAPVILIVEDSPDMRRYLHDHLAPDYHVVEAADGAEGLERARATEPDLVISDVMMPAMDGYTLCRTLKADPQLNHIPVVLLTALASEGDKVEGLETGADDYLYKPFNAEELRIRAENLIDIRRKLRRRFSREVVAVEVSESAVPSADRAFLDQVQEAVERHLSDTHFTVEWLADEVALSPRQLQRRLKTLTGLSAAGYIRCLRLQRAAQELERNAGTVAEIAYRVGFKDPEYFSRLFRQVYGVLPSQYH